MPTDDEILSVLTVFANRCAAEALSSYYGRHDHSFAISDLRRMFARTEPERMSVRLDIAARIIAEWSTSESRIERSDWLRALEIADIGIAADKESCRG